MWFSRWSLLMKCDFVSTIMPNKQQGRGYYILREKNTVIVENDIILFYTPPVILWGYFSVVYS